MERNEHDNQEPSANQALLQDILDAFIRHPDDLETWSETGTANNQPVETLTFRVNADDYPVVVGFEGKVIMAISTIFKFIAARDAMIIRLLLLEPATGEKQPFGAPGDAPYDPEFITDLARSVLGRMLAKPFTVDIFAIDGAGKLEIEVTASELELATGFGPYFKNVFNAVGRFQGQKLHVEIRPRIEIPK